MALLRERLKAAFRQVLVLWLAHRHIGVGYALPPARQRKVLVQRRRTQRTLASGHDLLRFRVAPRLIVERRRVINESGGLFVIAETPLEAVKQIERFLEARR